jgi:predicted glutamine amidotransferase
MSYDGLSDVYNATHFVLDTEEIAVYLRLYLLLYADDTVILAESKEELQAALNSMYLYCKTWDLEINASKTKIVIFNKRKITEKSVFTLNNEILNVVDDFTYLGIIFMHNGSFSKNRIKLLDQGRKVMYSMLKKCRSLGLPIDLQLKMFDTMVAPILLYGCEIWGFENINAIESLFFCNFIKLYWVLKSLLQIVFYMENLVDFL